MDYNGFEINWDGNGSLRVTDDGFTVAVNPVGDISPDFEADLVLVTGDEPGKFDREKIREVCSERTCVVVPESMKEKDIPCNDIEVIDGGETVDIFGIKIEAFSNQDQGVGYLFEMRDRSFYVAGDTELIDGFMELENRVNLAFLPISGEEMMGADEAIKAAVRIKPELVVPYYYSLEQLESRGVNLKAFQAELEDRNIGCEILERNAK